MSAFGNLLRKGEDGMLMFWCPGCDGIHQVRVRTPDNSQRPSWEFNNDCERPTFSPSILVTGQTMTPDSWKQYNAWAELPEPKPPRPEIQRVKTVCHSFITDGQIQFLNDCTHPLAGQTVPLPNFDQAMENS